MLTDLHPSANIQILGEALAWDTPVEIEEAPSTAETGFDELRRKFLLRTEEDTVRTAIATFFPRGQRINLSENLWIKSASGRQLGDHLFEADVALKGRIGPLRYHRRVDAADQAISSGSVLVNEPVGYPFTHPATYEPFRGTEAGLTCTTSYVTTVAPDFTDVSQTTSGLASGYNALPAGYPVLPTGPSSFWTSIAAPTYIYPAGWVLSARRVDAIRNDSGVEVCWHVEDLHAYFHQKQPSS